MYKSELLSPAGSYESAIAAIQNGADAIYLGGLRFGARAFAQNFDEELLRKTIAYAHAYGVKVYITLNTLIHEDELEECYKYIDLLYHLQADALIIQDLGILYYVRKNYPSFEVHASTQMHSLNASALKFLKSIGVKRVVLPRETTIEEIRELKKEGIELEVFVHGALCVSYSGQCLMSYMVGGRSGNRGECAQSCRMPYTLCDFKSGKTYGKTSYLLSLKDLNVLKHIEELQKIGVDSFKIEGRMKKSEYVAHLTKMYRMAMDNPKYKGTKEDVKKAMSLFHRGYTEGWMYHKKGSALYNPHRPNHIGIVVGNIIGSSKNRIKVKLTEDLSQGDGVRILLEKEDYGFKVNKIYDSKNYLINCGKKGSIVELECPIKVEENSTLLKTSDVLYEKEIRTTYDEYRRKVKISMNFYACENEPMYLTISDEENSITLTSENRIEKASSRSATEEDVKLRLSKINNTIFELEEIDVHLEGSLFIPIKELNALRREGLEQLYLLRSKNNNREKVGFTLPSKKFIKREASITTKVTTEEQLQSALEYPFRKIYVEDEHLYESYKEDKRVCLCASRVHKNRYDNVEIISEIGGLNKEEFECETSLNVCNSNNVYFLASLGATKITMSYELSLSQIRNINEIVKEKYEIDGYLESVVYGRCEVMISKHCPINASILDNDKVNCKLCRNKTYALKDKFNNVYPMHNDLSCNMHLYDYKIINHISEIKENLNNNISCRLNFTFENKEEMKAILKQVFKG